MSSGLLLSESESESSRSSGNQSVLLSRSGSIKDKLEEYSAKLNQLQLGDENSDENIEETKSASDTTSTIGQSVETSKVDSSRESKPVHSYDRNDPTTRTEEEVPRQKITARFQPIGSVKPINPKVCQIASDQPFSAIVRFLCKKLKLDGVHCYINNAFAPSPDQNLGDLWNQFSVNNELIISYCETVAFG